ncbi:MAG: GMC oxidoreductase [Candidatus Aminicenantia bacterium]
MGVEGEILYNGKSGPTVKVEAKVVVLSAGAINTPQLLLKNELCNSSGQVGKNLSLQPLAPVIAQFDAELHSYQGIPQSYYCDEFKDFSKGGFIIEGVFAHPGTMSAVYPSLGKEYMDFAGNYAKQAATIVMVQDNSSGKVTLSKNGPPVIDYNLSKKDKKLAIEGMKKTVQIFLKAGAKNVFITHVKPTLIEDPKDIKVLDERGMDLSELVLFSAHPQGSCRMGGDPSISEVNSNCEFHDVKNLFICDASVFPTSVGVNPQISVMAIATHTAAYIQKNADKYFS